MLLKKGAIREKNIVVLMKDDIATNVKNVQPETIINHPNGKDVYAGVPKNYTDAAMMVTNIKAIVRGDRYGVKGWSGMVLKSRPNDKIFLFFSGHGCNVSLLKPSVFRKVIYILIFGNLYPYRIRISFLAS
ncbi:putative legumain protein [Helianthus anomalus]